MGIFLLHALDKQFLSAISDGTELLS